MRIEWEKSSDSGWEKNEKDKFVEYFEKKIWPDFYQLLDKQLINALGVNLYETLTDNVNVRIDFEIYPEGNIKIYIFPWICTHKPETIGDAWGEKMIEKEPWLVGRYNKK